MNRQQRIRHDIVAKLIELESELMPSNPSRQEVATHGADLVMRIGRALEWEKQNNPDFWLTIEQRLLKSYEQLFGTFKRLELKPSTVSRESGIEELDFGVRVYNSLKRAQINTIGELLDWMASPERIVNLGEKGYAEIISRTAPLLEQLHGEEG